MKMLQDDDEEKYKAHFSRFIKEGLNSDNVRTTSVYIYTLIGCGHVTVIWSCDIIG